MSQQNKYDDPDFFAAYAKMPRSLGGLDAAGEWHVFKALLPEVGNKEVLDLGCGFGWHCRYMREQGARSVTGVDISEKMLQKARAMTNDGAVLYVQMPIEEINFPDSRFDLVISSLAFHYVKSFEAICRKVYACLKPDGTFLFSIEHPIFTSRNEQDWWYDEHGKRLHWPVDNYQSQGVRKTRFLTEDVIKYHRTVSTYVNDVIGAGFLVKAVKEPLPSEEMLKTIPEMGDELRRPMFLMVLAEKKER